ncbi:MAG TPA: metalloregulator ArsR/SmtB family transcription factor [Alphaproteobacteria bacterium]|nr:metalloregulator ArsR/SmtB family transcription factor [Alphaproteobacteria bacterium]
MAKHDEMKEALEVLKTLNHPVRLSILCNLIEKQEMSAGEIFEQEKELASQSQVSQYLKWLRDKGYVESRKEGQFVYYKISSPEIRELIAKMHELFCDNNTFCRK